VETGTAPALRPNEVELARRLVEQLSTETFEPERYRDEYRTRVREVVERKVAGEEVTVAEAEPARAQVIDLMEALKASLSRGRGRREPRPSEAAETPPARRPAAAARRRETAAPRRRANKK
jgi:DNA end-binding protein Ku